MALFDKPEYKSLVEDFPEGTPFQIVWATFDGVQATAFGMSPQATIGVADLKSDDPDETGTSYRVFGNLANQISQMDADSELPLGAKLGKAGRANVFLPLDPEDLPY